MASNQREIKFRAWHRENKRMMWCGYNSITNEVCSDGLRSDDADNYEVMQYTGLKDKNGKEIYEGDILEYRSYKGIVEWGIGKAGRIATGGQHNKDMCMDLGLFAKDYEVVGNIYQNPELLGTK